MTLDSWFTGPSLLNSSGVSCSVPGREICVGEPVDCYRNLNRKNTFSVKSRTGALKGLVTAYGRSVIVAMPSLIVGEKARLRVVQEGVKNVHSYVRGQVVGLFDGDLIDARMKKCVRVSYSPFVGPEFYRLDRDDDSRCITESIRPIEQSILENTTLAILNGSDVYLYVDGY